jgi:hypothetical protein
MVAYSDDNMALFELKVIKSLYQLTIQGPNLLLKFAIQYILYMWSCLCHLLPYLLKPSTPINQEFYLNLFFHTSRMVPINDLALLSDRNKNDKHIHIELVSITWSRDIA